MTDVTDTRVPWAFPCRSCGGTGEVPQLACPCCRMEARLTGGTFPVYTERAVKRWKADGLTDFPCGHGMMASAEKLARPCRNCVRGAVTRPVSPEKAERLARLAQKREKQQRATVAAINARLSDSSRKTWNCPCEARTRAGGRCQRKCVLGRVRCVQHGGAPLSVAGRQAIIDSNRRRAGQNKAGRATR